MRDHWYLSGRGPKHKWREKKRHPVVHDHTENFDFSNITHAIFAFQISHWIFLLFKYHTWHLGFSNITHAKNPVLKIRLVPSSWPENVFFLTAFNHYGRISAQLFNELHDPLITFLLFVRWKRLIARNDHELFSSNRGVSHWNEARCIDELSRGPILGYEIHTNN